MTDLPSFPRNREQTYLAAIVERLDRQNELLADVRDRLPQSGEPAPGGVDGGQQAPEELTEPAPPPGAGENTPLAEPAAPKKRTPAKSAPANKTTSRTSSGRGRTTQPRKGT